MGGDFNAILSCEDRFQGNVVTGSETVDFQSCVEENGLQEVRAVGVSLPRLITRRVTGGYGLILIDALPTVNGCLLTLM